MAEQGRPPGTGTGGASGSASEAEARLRGTAERVKADAQHAGKEVVDRVHGELDAEKDRTSGRIDDVARAARRAADELEGQEDWLAQSIDSAAGELEGLARGVRDKSVGELIGDLETFGRRYPAALFGVAAAIGFGAVRFAKSSEERRRSERGAGASGTQPHAMMTSTPKHLGDAVSPPGADVVSPDASAPTGRIG